MRLAYLSPLPPDRTGIADYSACLLPELIRLAEVEVFTSETGLSSAAELGIPAHPYRAFDARSREAPFDLALYQMGNSEHHIEILELALRHPGLVVLHEFVLHHLIHEITRGRGNAEAFVEEMRYCYGRTGEEAARAAVAFEMPLDFFAFPLFERLLDRSLAVAVHNRTTARRIRAARPLARVEVVASAIDHARLVRDRRPERARERFGLGAETFLIGTFGLITGAKRIEPTLRALRALRNDAPSAHLVIAGAVSPYYDLESLIDEDLAGAVTVTGRLDEQSFLDLMAAVDVGVNLRYPSAGETSYTLLSLMALAKPVLVSRHGPTGELPDSVVVPVPLGRDEASWLTEALAVLAREPTTRAQRGRAARRFVEEHHAPDRVAHRYLEIAEGTVAHGEPPGEPAPPLRAYPANDVATAVVAKVGAALADLGAGERDPVLESVARRMAELGW